MSNCAMAVQVAGAALRVRLGALPGRFWIFTTAAIFLLVIDVITVTTGSDREPTLWCTVLIVVLGSAASLYPRVGGGLLVATSAVIHLLPVSVAEVGAAPVLSYFVFVLWVAKGWYWAFIAGVVVEQAASYASYASASAFVESAAVVTLLCGVSGYLIGEYQRRGDRLAQRVHALELERELAESKIRATLGADLHDTLATDLTQIILRCQIAAGEEQVPAIALAEIENDTRTALQHVRSIVTVLRPAAGKTRSWDARAAAHECAEMLRGHGFYVDMETEGVDDGGQPAAAHGELLGLVLREATVNILKYAADKGDVNITLSLTDEGDGVTVSSALPEGSDQVKARAEPQLSGGQGLDIMRERIENAGGVLHVGPVGSRWVVTCMLPGKGK
ncbi:MAG: hypothetical protein E7Z95_00580 [Actinomyces succiniciruminis]|nr:hypothetical protein [Actinomyces succiniciruminis]